jgi:hypothetical protein
MNKPSGLPRVGETVHDPVFCGGATLKVVRTLPPKRSAYPQGQRGWRVTVQVMPDDRGRVSRPKRCWSLATWLDTVARSALDQEPTP